MSKIVLNDVTNLNTLSVINDNFDKIEQELQNKVMYRDNPEGEPNTLESDVDANGNSLYNVNNLTIQGSFTVDGQDVGTYISQAQEAADEAAQSAIAAANSSASAASSASSASSSASTATAQATIATTKANEASSSASSAASSAATATTQASVATTQAGIATTQANTATTQAANSAASATAAASSATSSSNSATASETSATNSANSATASAASASASAASAAAAALALDNFDDRYLGVKSTAPTLDNDGNALVAGALYFNNGTVVSDDKGMWVYDGSTWIAASAASQAILVTYEYVATAGQTTFSGNDANGVSLAYTAGSIIVCLNGVKLRPGNDYTASNGTSVVLASGAAAGDDLTVDAFSTFDVANTYTQAQVNALLASKLDTTAGAVGASNLASGSVTTAKIADGAATGAKLGSDVVVTSGDQTIGGNKTFINGVRFNDGTQQNSAFIGGRGQVFTASGTFTIPTGVTALKVTVLGGGGGGGGNSNVPCGSVFYGGGGGCGGLSIRFITGLTPGGTVAVTVGAGGSGGGVAGAGGTGGTSSFGAFCSATGGSGGGSSASTVAASGVGSGGAFNLKGPMSMWSTNGSVFGGGYGENSYFGQGADRKSAAGNGNAATIGYGGGGGGSLSGDVARAGGAGAAGMVLVEW